MEIMSLREDFNEAAENRIQTILDRLKKAPEGAAVVDFIKQNNIVFSLEEDKDNYASSTAIIIAIKDGIYEYKNPLVILRESLSDDNLAQAIVHEVGHLRQHLGKVGNPDRILSQDQYILFYRAAEADAQAWATQVAWALKQQGDAGPWQAAKDVGYADICDAYEKTVMEDPSSASDGRARREAFDAWFAKDSRLAGYNRSTADRMISFLEKGREIFKSHGMEQKPLDATWLKKLESCTPDMYLHLDGYRDPLTDPFYSRDTHTRPAPEPAPDPSKGLLPPPPPPKYARGPFR